MTTNLNCVPEIARDQMALTKRRFSKEKGIVAFHAYQSFAPGEVTPDQAHALGVELAKRFWGDRFEVIVATHLNTHCCHNHFVVNSVSFADGKKFNDCKAFYRTMRQTSDTLCREHALSVIQNPQTSRARYDTVQAAKRGEPIMYNLIRADVDAAITRCYLPRDLPPELRRIGYAVKTNVKYMAVRPEGRPRFVRLKTLGGNYTAEAIERRIMQQRQLGYTRPKRPLLPEPRHYRLKGNVIVHNKQYADIDPTAKLLYGDLLSRMELSRKNNWIDRQRRGFIIYTVQEICDTFRCKRDKAMKLLRQLEQAALIERTHQGAGRADRVYVKKFIRVGKTDSR